MRIVVNGQPTELPEGTSVRGLLERLGLENAPCATEVNRELVPRRQQEGRTLREGDVVEVVTLVGGG
jgi:sulfur carrier protein